MRSLGLTSEQLLLVLLRLQTMLWGVAGFLWAARAVVKQATGLLRDGCGFLNEFRTGGLARR